MRPGQPCKGIRNELVENTGENLVRVKPENYHCRSLNILTGRHEIFAIHFKGGLFTWWRQRTTAFRVRETEG